MVGTYAVRFCADINSAVAESNEGNNCSPPTYVTVSNAGPHASADSMTLHGVWYGTGGYTQGCINPLTNDTSPQGYTLTVTGVGTTSQSGSSATYTSSQVCYYWPNVSSSATDSFTYTISDGHGGTSSATVTVNISYP